MPTASAPARPPSPSAELLPSAADVSPPNVAGGSYLALGDSLAVGVGATMPSELGYTARIAHLIGVERFTNLAVSGETSGSFIDGGQLAAATTAIATSNPPVTLVTLDIGGNDLLRLLGTEPCASSPSTAGCRQLVVATVQRFEENFRQIVGELHAALEATGSPARLAVMAYFNPFSGTDAAHEAAADVALLGADATIDCSRTDPAHRGMNDVIACVGRDAGAVVVDVQPAFVGLGLELTHIGMDDIHANDRGYELIADAFVAALGAE